MQVVDIATDHGSCSKQHCVIQFRLFERVDEDSTRHQSIRPYLMDLESTNGTFIKGKSDWTRLEAARYYELKEGDVIKVGNSSREYVIIKSK